ncbi:MAG: FtsQ-type POTRA domain-containing protein [Microthrixaceae bacterium]|nr:FtsQ-type POTRA domain-containing protein [Microthrixaceae bacterium]
MARPNDVHPKIARRREQVDRRSRRRRMLLRWGSVGVAVVCTLVVAALFSPLVDLDHLTVQGLEGEPAVAVREASGLVSGTAMFGVRPSEVRRRVESLPWVAHADVDARWPDTVTVSVTPHRPLAVMQTAHGSPEGARQGGRSVLTTSGVVLEAEDLGPVGALAEGLPVVSADPSYAASGARTVLSGSTRRSPGRCSGNSAPSQQVR